MKFNETYKDTSKYGGAEIEIFRHLKMSNEEGAWSFFTANVDTKSRSKHLLATDSIEFISVENNLEPESIKEFIRNNPSIRIITKLLKGIF